MVKETFRKAVEDVTQSTELLEVSSNIKRDVKRVVGSNTKKQRQKER